MNKRIYIIGLPGAGKTTAGRQLAKKLHLPFVDLDKYIEDAEGKTVPAIFEELGEQGFRSLESKYLQQYTNVNQRFVLSCGGGTPCFNNNMGFMNENGLTVYLNPPIYFTAQRLANSKRVRPLLANTKPEDLPAQIEEILSHRGPYYQQAKVIVDSVDSMVDVLEKLVVGGS